MPAPCTCTSTDEVT